MMICLSASSENRTQTWQRPWRQLPGFSLAEMIITVAILGVLAGVVIISLSGAFEASRDTMARERVEMLNIGLNKFAATNYNLTFTPQQGSAMDEMFVLRSLQYRNPDAAHARTGSPYVTPRYNPMPSSSITDHRLRWTGRLFELLLPGATGTGIKIEFDGSDMSEPYEFPPNFQMAGR